MMELGGEGLHPMNVQFVITEYLQAALAEAEYDKLPDGSFSGRVPACTGVVAFASTLKGCELELRSTLEDWLLLGLKLGHSLPVVGEIDLNQDSSHATMETL